VKLNILYPDCRVFIPVSNGTGIIKNQPRNLRVIARNKVMAHGIQPVLKRRVRMSVNEAQMIASTSDAVQTLDCV